jgi:hypothetical protein
MKNHSLLIVKLMVALMLIIAMNSCTTHNAKRYAKKHGLTTRGCRSLKAHPDYKKHAHYKKRR